MQNDNLQFDQLMELYNHIGEEERHFNNLELEYRKLASQWLLVSLGAVGFVITKEASVPINIWVLVIGICLVSSVGISILWMLDMKVYHELLHAAFKEGVLLERKYPNLLPQIRNNMAQTQEGGDIIKRVMLYYFFSVLLLVLIANISVWMLSSPSVFRNFGVHLLSVGVLFWVYNLMTRKTARTF